MYTLYTVTLKVAEGLFNQSNAEYICSKSLGKKEKGKGKKEKMGLQRYLTGILFMGGYAQVIKCMHI